MSMCVLIEIQYIYEHENDDQMSGLFNDSDKVSSEVLLKILIHVQ